MVKRGQRGVNKGAWTAEEDKKLVNYVMAHGDNKWRALPANAGLKRCGKSCRMRWLNYLRPGIKRGNISEEEEDLIIRLHNLLGNRWSLIAGRIPGRTDNEIKNHWNTHLSKRSLTIADLNNKLNTASLSISTSNNSSPSSSIALESNPSFPELDGQLASSWVDIDELFNFVPISNQDPGSSCSELGVEDYGIARIDGYQEYLMSEDCNINSQIGYLNSELKSCSSDQFDDLDQFLDSQDLRLCFSNC